jgi:hypothetical protein
LPAGDQWPLETDAVAGGGRLVEDFGSGRGLFPEEGVESDWMLIEGMAGIETSIVGASGSFIVGIEGSSGRFIVGTEVVESGKLMVGIGTGALFIWVVGVSGR